MAPATGGSGARAAAYRGPPSRGARPERTKVNRGSHENMMLVKMKGIKLYGILMSTFFSCVGGCDATLVVVGAFGEEETVCEVEGEPAESAQQLH